jgi:lipase chaperone LimK
VTGASRILVGVLAALVFVGLAVWTAKDELGGERPVLAEGDAQAEAERGDPRRPGVPDSLRGTEVDGALVVGADGRFVPSKDTVRLFDYFLSVHGEEAEELTLARLDERIAQRLPADAVPDARAFLARYVQYRERGRELEQALERAVEPGGADVLAGRLAELRALRREIFGAELAQTLFGDDESLAEAAIERRRIFDDPSLSDRARIEKLAEVQSRLPESVRRSEEEALVPLRLHEDEAAAIAAGASRAEIQTLRERAVGRDAAERLADLDQQRADWDRRIEVYRLERDRVLANIGDAPEAQKSEFMKRVRERHFKQDELPRVEALDRIDLRERAGDTTPPPPGAPPQR